MAARINRTRLARILGLPADAPDARIVQAIRQLFRKYRQYGRPFVLPRGLGLENILAAVDARIEDELALQALTDARWVELKERRDEQDRLQTIRLMGLHTIREAHSAPEEPDPAGG